MSAGRDWKLNREDGPCLSDEYIRKVLKFPKVGVHAIAQASYSAHDLEADRRATRQAELKRLIVGYEADIDRLHRTVAALRQEHLLIEVGRG